MQLTCFSRDSSKWGRYSAMHLQKKKTILWTDRENWQEYTRVEAKIDIWLTYIPSNHGGSLTSSIENRVFNSEVETNFNRGGEGVETYFFPTGNTTCIIMKPVLFMMKEK